MSGGASDSSPRSVLGPFQLELLEAFFAREQRLVLYTVLPRTDKYKAKHFNDTFVYRAAD